MSSGARRSGASSSSLRRSAAVASGAARNDDYFDYIDELDDDDEDDDDDEEDDMLAIGRFGSSNMLVLDEDIGQNSDDDDDQFEANVKSFIRQQNIVHGLNEPPREVGEATLYGEYHQPVQSGGFPAYTTALAVASANATKETAESKVFPDYATALAMASAAAKKRPVQSVEFPDYATALAMASAAAKKEPRSSGRSRDDDNQSDIGSAPSYANSEAFDQFDDDELINQQFSGAHDQPVDNLASSGSSGAPGTISAANIVSDPIRRASFNQRRRTSYASSNSDQSFHSAPSPYQYGEAEGGATGTDRRRPLSISVPNAEGAGSARRSFTGGSRSSVRRKSVQVKSLVGSAGTGSSASASFADNSSSHYRRPSDTNEEEESGGILSRANSGSISSAVSLLTFRNRRSRHTRQSMSIQASQGPSGTLDSAIDTLRNQDSNNEWENVAAAVTIVAASEAGGHSASKSRQHKFGVNDTVLVFLTLLNVTNMEDPKDTFTVAPVNKNGYPAGEGRTEEEKSGPYTFVLCTVKHVHFDEDDRYYTVERADTGTQQRADSGWMEPLSDPDGIEAASRAAMRTTRSTQDKPEEVLEETGAWQNCFDTFMDIASWPSDFFLSTMLPLFRKLRLALKRLLTQLLLGDDPFSCKLRVTGINLLVLCSIAFLFLETINLAFLPADLDGEMAVVGT
jgi:hypothetical protein